MAETCHQPSDKVIAPHVVAGLATVLAAGAVTADPVALEARKAGDVANPAPTARLRTRHTTAPPNRDRLATWFRHGPNLGGRRIRFEGGHAVRAMCIASVPESR
jgi:hypothetical protein